MDQRLKEKIEQELHESTKKTPLSTGLNLLEPVYEGTIWLVGGTVANITLSIIHNQTLQKPKDTDIMLEDKIDYSLIRTPDGWERKVSSLGALKFIKDKKMIDIWYNGDSNKYKERGLEPTLKNYFKVVPFDIQAIAYDINKKELLISDSCLSALKTRTITINCRKRALEYKDPIGYMQKKAEALGLTVILT